MNCMATYIYETTNETGPVKRYEIQQSMKDAPLTRHPESGEAIRRVISGGYGVVSKGAGQNAAPPISGGGSCGTACGCH
jgi:predicted nucleic acid-binding Zn ribbon protein